VARAAAGFHRVNRVAVGFSFPLLLVFQVSVRVDGREVLREPLPRLRALWEDTSFQLERLQANEMCVKQEEEGLARRTQPYFKLTFDPSDVPSISQRRKTFLQRSSVLKHVAGQSLITDY